MTNSLMQLGSAVIGTVCITTALIALVPEGQWLSLATLAIGQQILSMAVRSALK